MFYKQNGSKIVNKEEINYEADGGESTSYRRQVWYAVVLAILINGILMVSSYNYAQYLAYKESVQVINLENYKMYNQDRKLSNINQKNIEKKDIDKKHSSLIVSLN